MSPKSRRSLIALNFSDRKYCSETFEERSILSKYKEGDNFNRRNTRSISRIARKLHFVPKFEPDAVIGQKRALCKGLSIFIKVRELHRKSTPPLCRRSQ